MSKEQIEYLDRPPFSGTVKELNLNPIFNKIWDKAKPLLAEGRHWDLWHTEISIEHMQEILKGEDKEYLSPVLIPAIILHDIGWSEIGDEKNVSWGKAGMRKKHMEEGVRLAREILEAINYDPKQINVIVDLIGGHDNAYLGIEPQTEQEKLLRDADACFILSYPSFWKDLNVKGKGLDLHLIERQFEKYGKRYTKTAQKITDRQIQTRREEMEDVSISPEERFEEIMDVVKRKKASI